MITTLRRSLLLAAMLGAKLLSAQTSILLKDINTTTTGVGSSVSKGVWMGSWYYFSANDIMNGAELWKSNGAGTTVMVKDINAGNAGSSPNNFAVIGSTLFFTASDGVSGTELWKTDGTTAGTVLVKDIRAGLNGSNPSSLVVIGSTLIFYANEETTGSEMWKSDGTEAGTVLIKEIMPGYVGGGINRVISTGTKVYFGANNSSSGANYELYKTDGTTAGTGLVKEINPSLTIGSMSGSVFTWGENLFFAADDGSTGIELWKSDGTAAGTVLVKDIYPGSNLNNGNPGSFCLMNGKLYFSATDATNGTELWVTDGTTAGTMLVKDIYTGTTGSSIASITAIGNLIFFRATSNGSGAELWKSDGTTAGTSIVTEINPGSGSSSPNQLAVMGSYLYFQANDGTNGVELWRTDGTAAGTMMLKDINAGSPNSSPASLVTNGSIILFSADNGINGSELWKTDGTTPGTVIEKNIALDNGVSAITNITPLGSKVIFTANDGVNGVEIWGTNGTTAGTTLLKDINTTANTGSSPQKLTYYNGGVYFAANNGSSLNGSEPWKTDGTAAGTVMLKDIYAGTNSSSPTNFFPHNGLLFFGASDATNGGELWKTDGTTANTSLVKDIVAGTYSLSPGSSGSIPEMCSNGTTLFFSGLNQIPGQETGWELFASTGAAGNGALVKDINTTSLAANSAPSNFVYLGTGSNVYFIADDGVNGSELWKSDGTAGGTALVKDITPGIQGSNFSRLTAYNGKFYFTVFTPANGAEMWVSDGTTAGTTLFMDIQAGTASSSPQNMMVGGSYLYFTADDGTNGRELWRTDGTVGGTMMVADINTGAGSSVPTNLIWHPGFQSVFFTAYTPATGVEIWQFDGSSAKLYTEVVVGTGGSNPGPLMIANNNLVFVATNGTNGLELYGTQIYNAWGGAASSVWTSTSNWSNGIVPGATESALLPAIGVANEAVLDIDVTVMRLELQTGRVLTIPATKTMSVTDLVINNGTIQGNGTLTVTTFTNTGTIMPGNGTTAGVLSITGNLVNTGNLDFKLGGTSPGTQYDQLAINGNVVIGGVLDLSTINGFTPVIGQTFTLVTGTTVTGAFSAVNWPAGITGTVSYTGNAVTITIGGMTLPLRLISFKAAKTGEQVNTSWKTAEEANTAYFEVQRSTDAIMFVAVGNVTAVGSGANNYVWVDQHPVTGANYYRLKMVDKDGHSTYSQVVKIQFAVSGLTISPVPASNQVTLVVKDAVLAGTSARVYDARGAVITDIKLQQMTTIDISNWPVGTYLLKAANGAVTRIVKQ